MNPFNRQIQPGCCVPACPRGFTLAEILISIALALLLLLGINQVFKMSGDTIAQGYALGQLTRSERSLSSVLNADFLGNDPTSPASGILAPDVQPLLIIKSERQVLFRSLADLQADNDGPSVVSNAQQLRDFALTIDLNEDGDTSDPGEDLTVSGSGYNSTEYPSAATYNNGRNYRKDTLSFFTQSIFKRQTGQPDLDDLNGLDSNEKPDGFNTGITLDLDDKGTRPYAWVWYGHLRLPDNTPSSGGIHPDDALENSNGDFHGPGAGTPQTNPNNYFPTQWTLGRKQIIFDDQQPFTPDGTDPAAVSPTDYSVVDRIYTSATDYAPVVHLGRRNDHPNNSPPTNQNGESLEPLGYGTRALFRTRDGNPPNATYEDADEDAVALSAPYVPTGSGATQVIPQVQHGFFDYAARRFGGQLGPAMYRRLLDGGIQPSLPTDDGWWRRLVFNYRYDQDILADSNSRYVANTPLTYRFNANPFTTRPLGWQQQAMSSPILAPNCTQFIVEFAGDYVTQENDPTNPDRDDTIIRAEPDGVVDFYIREVTDPDGTDREVREIAWYGLPRDIDGDGRYDVQTVYQSLAGGGENTAGVLNRRQFPGPQAQTGGLSDPNRAFERFHSGLTTDFVPDITLATNAVGGASVTLSDDPDELAQYVAVWGPKDLEAGYAPYLIRITVQLIDANQRVPAGINRSFIFRVRR